MDYAYLKMEAKQQGVPVTELIALAPANDPFYVGKPADIRDGEWFLNLWREFGYTTGVHIRRMHYQIISQRRTILMPNGEPYENTDYCWNFITQAAKTARYLDYVPIDAFVDRRNPDPQIFSNWQAQEPTLDVIQNLYDFSLPDFPNEPYLYVYGYDGVQVTDIVIFCEKSTMNDVLVPLCEQYRCDLVTGVGEMSITAVANLMQRFRADGYCRIIYISDFDPAGQSMPVAVARKIEYFQRIRGYEELDIKLWPIALTEQQVRKYDLPRTPIKESERRAAKFEERHGDGAVELDALEALYPGELRRIVEAQLRLFYDRTLYNRVSDARKDLDGALKDITLDVRDQHAAEIAALRTEYAGLQDEFGSRFGDFSERLGALWATITQELRDASEDTLDEHPIPEGNEPQDPGGHLYDSANDYFDQLDTYRTFQGKT